MRAHIPAAVRTRAGADNREGVCERRWHRRDRVGGVRHDRDGKRAVRTTSSVAPPCISPWPRATSPAVQLVAPVGDDFPDSSARDAWLETRDVDLARGSTTRAGGDVSLARPVSRGHEPAGHRCTSTWASSTGFAPTIDPSACGAHPTSSSATSIPDAADAGCSISSTRRCLVGLDTIEPLDRQMRAHGARGDLVARVDLLVINDEEASDASPASEQHLARGAGDPRDGRQVGADQAWRVRGHSVLARRRCSPCRRSRSSTSSIRPGRGTRSPGACWGRSGRQRGSPPIAVAAAGDRLWHRASRRSSSKTSVHAAWQDLTRDDIETTIPPIRRPDGVLSVPGSALTSGQGGR